jgi:hypothetical protein
MAERSADPPFYEVVDNSDVRALRRAECVARSRWLVTHVELDSAVRRAAGDAELALEAHGEHLGALQAWQGAESLYVAARLGFRAQPLPSRRRA